jgi:tetratricopeptide (TPR) repeat protein
MLKKWFMVLLITLLPGICIAGGINVKSLDNQDWINIETANFNVLTNAKEKKALEIVRELENFKYFLAGVLGYEQRDLSEKVSVVVAKNKKTFSAMGVPNNYAGVFVSSPGYAILARGDRFRSSSEGGSSWGRSVVFHELVHLFMRNAYLEFALPIWFEEGAAEYFGTYVEKKDRVIIGSLIHLENRFNSLREVDGKFEDVDTDSLFKILQPELNIGAGNSRRQQEFIEKFYARASAVVHYMYADPDRMMQMYQYLRLLKNDIAVDEAFNQAFHMTYRELDHEVNRYMSKWAMTGLAIRIGEGGVEFPEVGYKTNDIAKQEAMGFLYSKISMLSEKFMGEGSHKELYAGLDELYPGLADMTIEKQLSEDPENVALIMRTADTYEKLEKYGVAIGLYEKALLMDDASPSVLNGFAWFLATVPDTTLRDPQRAIPLAEKAVGINKTPAILDTLAEAYYAAGSFQKAIEIINEAIALDPEYDYLKEQLEKFSEALEKT